MKYITYSRLFVSVCLLFSVLALRAQDTKKTEEPEEQTILKIIYTVNGYWQITHSQHGDPSWDNAVYHTGNMEVYFLTKNDAFRKYSEEWADRNGWKGAKSDNKAEWKYRTGGIDDYVLFGDWQACFQTYADLYTVHPEEKKIARAKEVMEYQMGTPRSDYWWWVDGLYMAMPIMSKLYKITGNRLYLEKMQEYLSYTDSILYDPQENLYYRDAKYVFPAHKTADGKKDFWARGNGWAFAAFARVLNDLPKKDSCRNDLVLRFKDMADAVIKCQNARGYWSRSMQDSLQAPGPESSGSALFTYGLLWGINNGILDAKKFLPPALKGWSFLVTDALQPDGQIGYVQPIGEKAVSGQIVDANSTANFGVGAFLLSACEAFRFFQEVNND